jgi:hypothetical protein
MPSLIEIKRDERISYFTQSTQKSKYMNLDKIVALA